MYIILINIFPDISFIWLWPFSQGHSRLWKFDFGKLEEGHKLIPTAIATDFHVFYNGPVWMFQSAPQLGHDDLLQGHQRSKSFALDNTVFHKLYSFWMSWTEMQGWFLVSRDLRWPLFMSLETRSLWPCFWILWAKVHFLHVFLWEKHLGPIQRLLCLGSNKWAR